MGRIRRRAAAVIRFIDTVTQAPVAGSSLCIQIRQKSPILWKEDGYVVVMEQPGVDSLDISVSGGHYSPTQFHVEVLRDAPVQICYIHLLPTAGYPFTREMAVIQGNCPPQGLYAVRMADAGQYRLMEDLTGGDSRIRLWGNERFSPGQLLLLNEGQRYEPVTLLAEEEMEYGYCVREQIRGNWKKGKTKVCSAIRISPDEQGRFCVAYDRVSKNGEKIRFLYGHCCLSEPEADTAARMTVEPESGTVARMTVEPEAGTADGMTTEPEAGTADSTAAETPGGKGASAADSTAAETPGGKGASAADSTAAEVPGGKGASAADGTAAETPGGKGASAADGTAAETLGGKGARAATGTEVEIREGQEIEIHVGG